MTKAASTYKESGKSGMLASNASTLNNVISGQERSNVISFTTRQPVPSASSAPVNGLSSQGPMSSADMSNAMTSVPEYVGKKPENTPGLGMPFTPTMP